MDIVVQRKWLTNNSTCGEMSINGEFFAYTLEPRYDQAKGKPFAIPEGVYGVDLLPSAHFQMITPHVQNVPGFTEIEIHPGNYPKDTEGCCLVGSMHSEDFIGNSKLTFLNLMKKLTTPITITYKDPDAGDIVS
jgi:hypothetical protein